MNIKFNKIETRHLIVSIVIMGFIFAFDDGQSKFEVSSWLTNFFIITFVVAISLIIHEISHRLIASKIKAKIEYRLWGIKRIGFWRNSKLPVKIFNLSINNFYIGAFLGLFLAIVSKGGFYFAALNQNIIEPDKERRAHKSFKELKNSEVISIAIIGPLVSIFLAAFFSLLGWKQGVFINSMLAIYSMLPFPRLDGGYIFFRSPFLYIFFAILIIMFLLLLNNTKFILALILALLSSSIITTYYIYYSNK